MRCTTIRQQWLSFEQDYVGNIATPMTGKRRYPVDPRSGRELP